MMNVLLENVLILLLSLVITVVVLVMVAVIGSELLSILHEIREEARVKQVITTAQAVPRTAHDTGPLRPRDGYGVIDPYQDRDTVERLIDYFSEDEESGR